MAHIKQIWFQDSGRTSCSMMVYISLKPSGSADIKVPIPPKFYNAIIALAQTAADNHEAQMRAEILGDTITKEPTDAE